MPTTTFAVIVTICLFAAYWTNQQLSNNFSLPYLETPTWYPSNRTFETAWLVLSVMTVYVGYTLYKAGDLNDDVVLQQNSVGQTFVAQLVLSILWQMVFFIWQELLLALVVILVLDYYVYKSMVQFAVQGGQGFLLVLPVAAWFAFLTVLNAMILWMN